MGKYAFKEQKNFDVFNKFSEENGGSVYQTSFWAEVKNAWQPSFYMGYEGDMPVLSALCLKRDVKVGNIWYIPDGFVCDYFNDGLVKEFSAFLKSEMKKKGIFAAVTDPLVIEKVNGEARDTSAVNSLISSGFVLNDDRSFYVVQPNVTIQTDLRGFTSETLLKKCEKGVRHGLKAVADGGLYYETYDDISLAKHPEKLDDFFEVMTETSDRLSFIQRDKKYYKNIIMALKGHALMNLVYCDNDKRKATCDDAVRKIKTLTDELNELESAEKKNKKKISAHKNDIDVLIRLIDRNRKADEEIKEKYGDDIPQKICIAVGITSRFGKTAICLYGGTRNLFRNTFRPTHYLNWLRIEKSIEDGIEMHDLGRITGDPYDESNPLYGLCKYKQSYHGDVTEFVGDMYFVGNKLKFILFRKLLPKFKAIKNTVFKKHIKSDTVKKADSEK